MCAPPGPVGHESNRDFTAAHPAPEDQIRSAKFNKPRRLTTQSSEYMASKRSDGRSKFEFLSVYLEVLTLSEYMAERWSRRSEMASLVLSTTISIPGSLRRRTSVSAIRGRQNQSFSPGSPGGGSLLPCCFAIFVNPSQSGTPCGKSRRFPMMGYGFGPGGYGSALLDRFRNQYHTGRVKKTGRTRDT